jgi:hypothetical protein
MNGCGAQRFLERYSDMPISSRRNTVVELNIGDHVRILSSSGIERSLNGERKTVMPNGEEMYWNKSMYRFCGHTGTVSGFDYIEPKCKDNDMGRILVDGDYDEDMIDWTFCRNWLELV